MDDIKQMAKTVAECIKGDTKKTKAYDTAAKVKRIENGTAYVEIPGGVSETPVKLTIDAKVGDNVQVHVGNGTAWLVGNQTAPPTDDAEALIAKAVAKVADKTANKAKTTAEQAETTANAVSGIANNALTQAQQAKQIADDTEQHFWFQETGADTGAHITEVTQDEWNDVSDPNYHSGGNFLGRSNGIALREGMAELATLQQSGLDVNTYDGGGNAVTIAHLGYGAGTDSGGGTSDAPYYDIGVRLSGSTKGNYSTVEGHDNTASGYDSHAEGGVNIASGTDSHCEGALNTASGVVSHCEGYISEASGDYSHAQNTDTIAQGQSQTAIGEYNIAQGTASSRSSSDYAFIIGNGTGNYARSNALTVDWAGNLIAQGMAGIIQMFAGSTAPTGWLVCDGSAVSRTTYATLFSVIGTTYGSGNGSTTFNLPDLRGRAPIGAGTGTATGATAHALADAGGNENLIVPYHRHSVSAVSGAITGGGHTHDAGDKQAFLRYNYGTVSTGVSERSVASGASGNYKAPVVNNSSVDFSYLSTTSNETHTHNLPAHNTDYTPSGGSGNATGANMMPYATVNFIICTGKTA